MAADLYTDGACSGNPGPGGWGWVTKDGRTGKGGAEHTTNQRMEVQAVLEGLRVIEGEVNVVSDSTYVVKCFNDRWYEGWKKRGWKNSQKKPVANRDLWEPLIELYLSRKAELTFTWVKGHSGDQYNEIADQLAVSARDQQMDERKSGKPDVDSAKVPWAVSKAIWVVGPSEMNADLEASLHEAISRLDPTSDSLVSGLRRGAELLAAELAIQSGIKLAAVLPFADPARNWPTDVRERFDAAAGKADWLVTLAGNANAPGKAVEARNQWLASAAVGAIVVCDTALADQLDGEGLSVVRIEPE